MTYASFVGYVPAEHPSYVIFVGIESPSVKESWGGAVAAPAFVRVATQALAR
jgi:cell division protein FtsI/penicillin-binding protein 2